MTKDLQSYNPDSLELWQRWPGEGDPPRMWWATDPKTKERVLVYRSYADYVG